jgi:hypothetical protein
MAPLGALSQAWVSAQASLPLGWQIVGVLRRERALRMLPVTDTARPEWCALAEDPAGMLYDGWGESHYQALNQLAIKLAKLRGSVTG